MRHHLRERGERGAALVELAIILALPLLGTDPRRAPGRAAGRLRDERGAALVEFALILPVFLIIIFGGITAAISYEHKEEIVHAVRDGARYGATLPYAQCDSSGCPSGRTWAQQVKYVTTLRSGGSISATDNVCVALVTGPGSTPAVYGTASNYSINYVNGSFTVDPAPLGIHWGR